MTIEHPDLDVAAAEAFEKLGREHANFAIDCRGDYEDAQAEFEDNLRDTLAEQHKGATGNQIEICLDAYREVWADFVKGPTP